MHYRQALIIDAVTLSDVEAPDKQWQITGHNSDSAHQLGLSFGQSGSGHLSDFFAPPLQST
jgi:hypothetical protein